MLGRSQQVENWVSDQGRLRPPKSQALGRILAGEDGFAGRVE